MKRLFRLTAFTGVLTAATALAQAADRPVQLQVPPDLSKGVAAMPLIAGPVDEAERRINAALPRLDANARKAVATWCKVDSKSQGGTGGWWERSVHVTMQGPRYISYEIDDNTFCGGAHPNVSTMAIVYDLTTGSPVDWTALLPSSLTGKLGLASGADGTKMVTLSGRTLYALYLTAYRPRSGNPKKDAGDDECREAVAAAGSNGASPGMMAWLDGKEGGLVVHFDLADVDEACADSVTVPAAALRAEGALAFLVDAIETAHTNSSRDH